MVSYMIPATILAVFLIPVSFCYAEMSPCPDTAAMHNIVSENHLKNWNDIYQSSKKYGSCDSGALSEGYSYVVVNTLAHQWETLAALKTLMSTDKSFERFVMKHINEAADPRDIVMVLSNTRERCPGNDVQLCSKIEKAVRKTLQDLGALKK